MGLECWIERDRWNPTAHVCPDQVLMVFLSVPLMHTPERKKKNLFSRFVRLLSCCRCCCCCGVAMIEETRMRVTPSTEQARPGNACVLVDVVRASMPTKERDGWTGKKRKRVSERETVSEREKESEFE